jgi:hypothetical protein
MEAAISRDVLPHLTYVAAGITRARAADASGAGTGLDDLVTATNTALESLRDLTRGLFPTQLARSGLEPALRSALARSGLAAALHLDRSVAGRRFAPMVEAAVYSCTVAASRGFAELSAIHVSLEQDELVVRLNGTRPGGSDLQGVLDRAEAVGGSLDTEVGGLVLRFPGETTRPKSLLADGGRPDL